MFQTAPLCQVNLSLQETAAHPPRAGGVMETTGRIHALKRRNVGKQNNVYAVGLTSIG